MHNDPRVPAVKNRVRMFNSNKVAPADLLLIPYKIHVIPFTVETDPSKYVFSVAVTNVGATRWDVCFSLHKGKC